MGFSGQPEPEIARFLKSVEVTVGARVGFEARLLLFTVVSRACIRLHALPHQSEDDQRKLCIFLAPSERDLYIYIYIWV